MKLSGSMIKVFAKIANGIRTIDGLKIEEHKSANWITEVLVDLEKEGLIIKKRDYPARGSRISVDVANTSHALKLKELIFNYPTINFEDILADSRVLFLAAASEDWIDTEEAAKLARISKYAIDRYRPVLKNRGIIVKKEGLYKINEKAWPLLKDFLVAYKNYPAANGIVRWKYNDEVIFESKKKLPGCAITGFTRYEEYGMKINTLSVLCRSPDEKLSKEEIFVHSLFEVSDPRTLHLAIVFYSKNKLDHNKTMATAMKYGKYTMFENITAIFKSKEEKIKIENMPAFERKDFRRIAGMYGVRIS
jgi:hypothetical protein